MKVLKQFPYRTAFVRGNVMVFDRAAMKSLENWLAEQVGAQKDNHVCYSVTDYKICFGRTDVAAGIMFTDSNCIIGSQIDEGKW